MCSCQFLSSIQTFCIYFDLLWILSFVMQCNALCRRWFSTAITVFVIFCYVLNMLMCILPDDDWWLLKQVGGIKNLCLHIFRMCKRLVFKIRITIELCLSRLIRTVSHTDMQKILMIGFFFENKLHLQFEVQLLLFMVCGCV